MSEVIETKTVLVNGKPLPFGYDCKSLTYDMGDPEITVRNAVNGGSNVSIHSENRETSIGMFKFDIFPTNDVDSNDSRVYVRSLKQNVGSNTITVTSLKGKTLRWSGLSCTNKIEFNDNPDGTVSLEFQGDASVIS